MPTSPTSGFTVPGIALLVVACAITLLGACNDETSARPVDSQTLEGPIAFVTNRDGNNEIYLMEMDGTNPRNLTNDDAVDGDPSWSPDGSRIAFVSNRKGNSDIFVMNADGSQVNRLTETPERESRPAWSPDGEQIAYCVTDQQESWICTMRADGTGVRKLCEGRLPSWSPDGEKIFINIGQMPVIRQMDSDGANLREVIPRNPNAKTREEEFKHMFNLLPVMSPDGQRILFTKVLLEKAKSEMNYEVHTMSADGDHFVRLTESEGEDQSCGWSPDGQKVLFCSERDGNAEIYVIDADGTNSRNLTRHESNDRNARWSPSGRGASQGP